MMATMTVGERAAASRKELLHKILSQKSNTTASSLSRAEKQPAVTSTELFQSPSLRSHKQSDDGREQIRPVGNDTNADNAITLPRAQSVLLSDLSTWGDEDQKLVSWFEQLAPDQLPTPPFALSPWATVNGNQFYIQLRACIAQGPKGVRAKMGALQDDLQRLKKIITQEPKPTTNVP